MFRQWSRWRRDEIGPVSLPLAIGLVMLVLSVALGSSHPLP